MGLNWTVTLGRRTWIFAALMGLAVMAPYRCFAQEQPPPILFPTLFHSPTNNNGYEEFVRAVDLAQTVPGINQAMQPGATLTAKRKVINSQQARDLFDLIKEGLQKPVRSPRTTMDSSTTFPELSGFRQVGRLLSIKIYVDFADGHVGSSIETLKVGVEFANRIQLDTLISGLVGIAIETTIEKSFAQHLDQLSYFDCDALQEVVRDRLHDESPAARIFAREVSLMCTMLDQSRSKVGNVVHTQDIGSEDAPTSAPIRALLERLTTHPEELSAAITTVETKIKQNYAIATDNVSLPVDKRKPYLHDTSNSPDAALFNALSVEPGNIVDRYSTCRSKLYLLALHALIHKYRWEHAALPGSLDELHRADFTIDPMTGKPFTYVVKGDTYTLSGMGSVKRDENGESLNQRDVLTVP